MIFVDTGAWFACFDAHDHHHEQAAAWLVRDSHLARTVAGFRSCQVAGKDSRESGCENGFSHQPPVHDKRWSFTDCTSRVVMERLGVKQAFSFDEHFRQFGTVAVVP